MSVKMTAEMAACLWIAENNDSIGGMNAVFCQKLVEKRPVFEAFYQLVEHGMMDHATARDGKKLADKYRITQHGRESLREGINMAIEDCIEKAKRSYSRDEVEALDTLKASLEECRHDLGTEPPIEKAPLHSEEEAEVVKSLHLSFKPEEMPPVPEPDLTRGLDRDERPTRREPSASTDSQAGGVTPAAPKKTQAPRKQPATRPERAGTAPASASADAPKRRDP